VKSPRNLAFALLLVNSAYIAAFPSATVFYVGNVVLHLGLGLALMIAAGFAIRRYPREGGAFLAAGLPALYLVLRGNTLDHRWVLWLHVMLAVAAVALLAARTRHVGAVGGLLALIVAGVAVMLARNGYITGQTINVNGGWYMC